MTCRRRARRWPRARGRCAPVVPRPSARWRTRVPSAEAMAPKIHVDTSWTLAPTVLLTVAVYAWVYVRRWRKVRRDHGARAAGVGHLVLWLTGLLCILVALISPIDRIAEQLASAHMIQHLLLADLAPIALILGLTKVMLRPVTRRVHVIERKAGPVAHPAFGVVAYVG